MNNINLLDKDNDYLAEVKMDNDLEMMAEQEEQERYDYEDAQFTNSLDSQAESFGGTNY